MTGIEATREIRKNNPTLPIIAVTAAAFQEDKDECLKAGMNDFVVRPVTVEILKKKLLEWTARKKKKSS
jgi:CheY-like chemotaxis protein